MDRKISILLVKLIVSSFISMGMGVGVWAGDIDGDKAIIQDQAHELAYVHGYKDGTIRPESYVTREEAAMIFYRLLDSDYREYIQTSEHGFIDVEEGRWSEEQIATLVKGNVLKGYDQEHFQPYGYITRAELATIISRFDSSEELVNNDFLDIKNHWAEDYINSAARKGWMLGYEDGSFRPDNKISRAELVSLINRVLNRSIELDKMASNDMDFSDLDKDKWYYRDIKEASNGFDYLIEY